MNRIAISSAASGLLRALIARAEVPRNRILLSNVQSTDWRSLTFNGERHLIELRITPPTATATLERMTVDLDDCEFSIPGLIVADIGVAEIDQVPDGSVCVKIEALTISED